MSQRKIGIVIFAIVVILAGGSAPTLAEPPPEMVQLPMSPPPRFKDIYAKWEPEGYFFVTEHYWENEAYISIYQRPWALNPISSGKTGEDSPLAHAQVGVFLAVKKGGQWRSQGLQKVSYLEAGGYGKLTEKEILFLKYAPGVYGFSFITLTGWDNAPLHQMTFFRLFRKNILPIFTTLVHYDSTSIRGAEKGIYADATVTPAWNTETKSTDLYFKLTTRGKYASRYESAYVISPLQEFFNGKEEVRLIYRGGQYIKPNKY